MPFTSLNLVNMTVTRTLMENPNTLKHINLANLLEN